MQGNTVVKLIVVAVVAYLVWTKGIPWIQSQGRPSETGAARATDNSCVASAQTASERWGSGITRFANPPYDSFAWDSFRGDVETKIRSAERKCSCSLESCIKVRQALSELRSVVGEADSMIRGSSAPPSGLVQRQESIDEAINEARELVLKGR